MTGSKRVQLFMFYLAKLESGQEIDDQYYGEYNSVLCFDAVQETLIDKREPHTWCIPRGFEENIYIGDVVEVETLEGTAYVKVVSVTYVKSKDKHAEEGHPYCCLIRISQED